MKNRDGSAISGVALLLEDLDLLLWIGHHDFCSLAKYSVKEYRVYAGGE